MSKNELTDVTVQLHHETHRAILVSDDGDSENGVWLPLSQIEYEKTNKPGIILVTLPTWLAKERGLI
jgi:hypothetical protein